MIGLFSQRAVDAGVQTGWYSTPLGGELEVTVVCTDNDDWSRWYKWPDTVVVGPVCTFLRPGRPGQHLSLPLNKFNN
jgi:hypothetical protein